MNVIKEIQRINELEISRNCAEDASWHEQYSDSAYIFFGGVPYELTEGDIIIIFSQFGEVVNVNLIRDASTGKSKGFGFLAYEDQRSTNLAVDNFNGAKIMDRYIRVDHVKNYENRMRLRKDFSEEEERKRLMKIIPKKLQPNDWKKEEGSEDKEKEDTGRDKRRKEKRRKSDRRKDKEGNRRKDKEGNRRKFHKLGRRSRSSRGSAEHF